MTHYFALNIWKKLTLHKHAIRKRKSTLIALSDNYWYSSLILSELSEILLFLKVGHNLEFEPLSMNLSCCYNIKIYWFLWHVEWIFYICMISYQAPVMLKILFSLSYTDLPNTAHFIIQYFKITLLSPPISPEKSLNIEATKFMISIIQSYHWQHIVWDIFLEVIGSLYSFLRKCLQRTQAWIRRRQWHPLQCSCLENPMDGGAW